MAWIDGGGGICSGQNDSEAALLMKKTLSILIADEEFRVGEPTWAEGVDIGSMTELRTKTAPLFSPEANEPWCWQRQNRRRNWKVQRSQPELSLQVQ